MHSTWLTFYFFRADTLLTIKICTAGNSDSEAALREIEISDYIKSIDAGDHPGIQRLRTVLDHFETEGLNGNRHQCLLFAPLGRSLTDARSLFPGHVFDERVLRLTLACILTGIDVLHQAGIIHTGMSKAAQPLQAISQGPSADTPFSRLVT